MRKPRIDILTLFPDYFQGPFTVSMVKRAQEKGAVDLKAPRPEEVGDG